MNITGVFLHVLADTLGSVVVCITSLVIMFTDWEYRFYLDPVLSLVIVLIILVSTWPLLRDSTLILLNTIPAHIDLLDLETRLVTTVAGVSSIHELHVWRLVGRRVVASCHLEMTPPPLGTEPVDHHMDVARQVKEFFHKAGIHSTTIQLEYWSPKLSRAGEKNDLGSCQLTCPRKESSSSGEFKVIGRSFSFVADKSFSGERRVRRGHLLSREAWSHQEVSLKVLSSIIQNIFQYCS